MTIPEQITKSVFITAPTTKVWDAITKPELMRQWMSPESEIEIITTWQPGSPFTINGPWYKTHFENKGTVLAYEPERQAAYSHLSSLSRLPDKPENYTYIAFLLTPEEYQTELQLTLSNFPNEGIYHHFNYYWNVALGLLKKQTEQLI